MNFVIEDMPMKRNYIAFFGVSVICLMGVYLFYTSGNKPPESSVLAMQSTSNLGQLEDNAAQHFSPSENVSNAQYEMASYKAEMDKKLALLRSEVDSLRRALLEQNMTAHPQATPENESSRAARNDSIAQAEEDRKSKQMMEAKDSEFRSEQADAQWSSQTSATIRQAVGNDPAFRDSVRNIDCRSSTCRVEISGSQQTGGNSKSLDGFVQQVGATLPQVSYFQIDNGNGESTVVMFMSREATQPTANEN
jgi:hypothetical protein